MHVGCGARGHSRASDTLGRSPRLLHAEPCEFADEVVLELGDVTTPSMRRFMASPPHGVENCRAASHPPAVLGMLLVNVLGGPSSS
jgi:hypothetical protein